MKLIVLIFIYSFSIFAQQLKPENTGCPENSHCSKTIGLKRSQWISELKKINQDSENSINARIKKSSLYPVSVWTNDDNKNNNDKIISWTSPCKQHNPPNPKILIAEIFIPDLSEKTVKKSENIIFNKIFYNEKNKYKFSYAPRGDAPLMIIDGKFYYIREEDGNYFGMLLSRDGDISIVKTKNVSLFPKEVECKKEMIEEFYKEAPTLTFFKGQVCKEIWNENKKAYDTIMIGWSCN